MSLLTPEVIGKELAARYFRDHAKLSAKMRDDSIEYRIRRKSELTDFMGADIDDLIEQEAIQSRARVAAQVIGAYVARARHSAGDIQRLSKGL